MRHTILWCLFLACLLITCDAKRRRRRGRWRGRVRAGWSQDAGWHVTAGLNFSFGKKRSANMGLLESSKCIPTLPCKFELYDTNEDGGLTLEEFENKLVEMGFEDRQYSIFTALDDDDDGTVTPEEFTLVATDLANDIIFPECVQRT